MSKTYALDIGHKKGAGTEFTRLTTRSKAAKLREIVERVENNTDGYDIDCWNLSRTIYNSRDNITSYHIYPTEKVKNET